MPTRELDLLDLDPFDLVEDEEPFVPQKATASAEDRLAETERLLAKALEVIARYEKRPVRAHLPGKHNQADHGRKKSGANALKVDAPKPARKTPSSRPMPSAEKQASFTEGSPALAAVPVHARINANNSDPSTWRATGFDGLPKGDREATEAITAYLRRPGLMNKRLRFRDDPAHPLHEQTWQELAFGDTPDPAAVGTAAALADRRIAALDRVMDQSRTTEGIVAWRGVGGDAGLSSLAVGDEFTDRGFVSTSLARSVAEGSFATDTLLRIRVGAGTPALSLAGLGEQEVLLGHGLRFKVVGRSTTKSGAVLLDVESVTPKRTRTRRKTSVEAKFDPNQPRDREGKFAETPGLSSPNAIDGIPVLDGEKYKGLYGDVVDDAGIDLGGDGDGPFLNARYFDNGDMHVSLHLEDGKVQVFEEMNPESMRQLAYDLERVLAVDETEFEGGDPYDIVADADSDMHGFYVAKDGVGDIWIGPPDADGEDHIEVSPEDAQDFIDALLALADSYEEHFDGEDDGEVVAAREVTAHLPGKHNQADHGRKGGLKDKLKIDVPEPARKSTAPATRKPAAEKKSAATKAGVDQARLKLDRAVQMHGSDRSKWSKKDRDAAAKLDKLIADSEGEPKPTRETAPPKASKRAAKPADRKKAPAKRSSRSAGLKSKIGLGEVDAVPVGTDTANKVEIVRLTDGSRVVRKSPRTDRYSGNSQREYDAEELGGAVARALGFDAPETYRPSDDLIYMAYVDDAKLADDVPGYRKLDLAGTKDGARLGLLDLLIFNYDRHNANWFITDDDRIIPIDHGSGWGDSSAAHPATPPMAPQNSFERLFTYNPWDEDVEVDDDEEDSRWAPSNPLSQASARRIATKLEALKAEFVRVGRADWHEQMMTRWAEIQRRAHGDMEL